VVNACHPEIGAVFLSCEFPITPGPPSIPGQIRTFVPTSIHNYLS
jgi:hypothetical protein